MIVAAGKGKRIKSKTLKPFILLNGKPLLYYSLKTFQDHPQVKSIILVAGESSLNKAYALVKKYKFLKVKCVVQGGKERKDSVISGLKQVDKNVSFILIHDAARPFVSKDLITKVLKALLNHKAVIPGIPAQDTLKYTDKKGLVKKTLKREYIYSIQTPQGIRTDLLPLLFKNYRKSKAVYDDAALVEQQTKVKVIPSSAKNFKITTPEDLLRAEYCLFRKK